MSGPSLASEYADPTPLQVRIAAHRDYSERADDPAAAVLAAVRLTGAEDLADIGCGDARFLARLSAGGHAGRLVGVDTAPAMIAAANAVPGVDGVPGDIRALPFGDDEFDVCTARHMLYHVPDPPAALRELRRVTRPGGTVVLTVNHARTCARTRELVCLHARSHGLRPPDGMLNDAVHSATLPPMMREVFGDVTVENYDNALIFDRPRPLIAFAEALFSFCGVAAGEPRRAQVLGDVSDEVERWFAERPGAVWRDPKGYIVVAATVA
ncbi:class I SAM-dependent methyltransferase [Nocardia harenae]|uniref:class I SAM-dependent methyltransferase n=1 Tax=Nocardia harenae TaxID=358707 RepID=UPI00082E16B4|nr:class I SAM-dependent methyltransferase [Nocardia harenae]